MQAATCATSLTPGTRSSRAISEAWREAGTTARSRRSCFQHRLGEFLNEQRDAVGSSCDLSQHFGGQALVPGQACNNRLGRAAAEAVQREPRHVRVSAESRLIVRSARQSIRTRAPAIWS